MVHALSVLLFGENMWGIRVLELLAVPLTGLMAATFTVARGERVHPGVRGVAILTAGVLFFGQLNWWDLSQSEVWYSLLGLCSVWAVRRVVQTPRAELASGAFAAAAVIMKPPAIWFVLVALIVLLVRVGEQPSGRMRAALLGLLRFGAGGLLVALPVFGYFGIVGALPDMFEIVVHTNAYYATHETEIRTLGALIERTVGFIHVFPYVNPLFVGGLLLATTAALLRRDRAVERHLVACALALAGIAATAMQRKFYLLHWTALLGPATVIGALLAADARDLLPRLRRAALAPLAFALVLLASWGASARFADWQQTQKHVLNYLRGDITREQYADYFRFPEVGFWYGDSERAGRWIREHSAPTDTIAVRGFEPQIYAIAEPELSGTVLLDHLPDLAHARRARPARALSRGRARAVRELAAALRGRARRCGQRPRQSRLLLSTRLRAAGRDGTLRDPRAHWAHPA